MIRYRLKPRVHRPGYDPTALYRFLEKDKVEGYIFLEKDGRRQCAWAADFEQVEVEPDEA